MAAPKFSDQQLYNLRNHIPIAAVITKLLQVPAKINCGTLRFCCPLCARFNTAINDRTNLARCFDCQKNFNPIDMVMATRKINFVQAVRLLKACEHHPQPQRPGQSKRNQNTAAPPHTPPASNHLEKSPLKPVPIADIIDDWVQKAPTPQPPEQADLFSTITAHIAELELAIGHLSDQINQFKVIVGKLQCKP
jgi:CHC2 zinc finger